MVADNHASRALLLAEELEKTLSNDGAASPSVLAKKLIAAMTAQAEHDQAIALSSAREAYREGFLLGRLTPRFVPFSAQMWRTSKIFQRLKARDLPSTQSASRYANQDDW